MTGGASSDRIRSAFVSWIGHHSRSARLAEAVGAPCHFIAVGRTGQKWLAPVRYIVQALLTLRLLMRTRPAVLWVMAPPLPLVLIGLAYARLTRTKLIIDAHSGAVQRVRNGQERRGLRVVAARADVIVVTNARLAAVVDSWGAATAIVDDPPLDVVDVLWRRPAAGEPFRLVFPASWESDEPLDSLFEATRGLPEIELTVTGRARGSRSNDASHVRFTGYLSDPEYAELLKRAHAIAALTTREMTMQRAGYEALAYGKPLVASDRAVLRDYFSRGTVFVEDDARSLAAGIGECVRRGEELSEQMRDLRAEKFAESERQVSELLSQVSKTDGSTG